MLSGVIINSPWYYFVLSILFGSCVSAFLYYRNRKNAGVSRAGLYFLSITRFLSATFVALLLLNIFFRRMTAETENPILLLAVDNSSSMVSGKDSAGQRELLNRTVASLKNKLEEKYKVIPLLFGSDVRPGATPGFEEKQTDIDRLFREADNGYANQNVGAMILLSDGIFNKGANPLGSAEKLPYPVYTIAAGDTSEQKDLAIAKVVHNEVAYAGNAFPVEINISAKHLKGKDFVVSVSREGAGKSDQTISIPSDDFFSTVTFTFEAKQPGVEKYTAKVSILEGEKNILNNARSFLLEVIDSRQKILLLASAPHPDVAAIKDVLALSPNFELTTGYFSEFSKPIQPYSLVILHGYSPTNAAVLKTCTDLSVPYWIINPQSPDQLPGIKIAGTFNRYNDVEPFYNSSFGMFALSPSLQRFVSDLPAVKSFFGNYSVNNNFNALVSQRIGSVETDNPLLTFSDMNGLKTAFFLGDGLWRWKMRDFAEHGNHDLFTELISKSLQYLAVKNDKSLFRVNAPRIADENTDVELGAELYNRSYEPVTEPDVTLVVTDKQNNKYNYTFGKSEKTYHLNLGKLSPGEYRYEAKTTSNNELFVKQGFFAVKEVVAENINTVADHNLLFRLSNRSKGKLYYPADAAQLADEIMKSEDIKPITYAHHSTSSPIDIRALFWILLFLFAVEWFMRKRLFSI